MWDERYSQPGFAYGTEPNEFLATAAGRIPDGPVLNLVQFIKQLRKDFDAPNAKFVLATLGESTKDGKGNGRMVLDAQLAVDGSAGKYPDFKGNVATTVYSNPLSLGGSGNSHGDIPGSAYRRKEREGSETPGPALPPDCAGERPVLCGQTVPQQ